MSEISDYVKAMNFEYPRNIPADVDLLPATWMKYREDLEAVVRRHPAIFGEYKGRDYDQVGMARHLPGKYADAWGCVWENIHAGMDAMVTGHPLPHREDVRRLRAPDHLDTGFEHGFMYLRLGDLRGFEEIMLDFAEEPPELQMLIDIVLTYNLRKLERALAAKPTWWLPVPGVMAFADDLGMQDGLAMGERKWRKYLKPCFMKIYSRCHAAGYKIFMHTDGHIHEIIPDLIECGVNVINPQFRANGLDNLVRVCKGKVCARLDLDRQMFPFCTPGDIDEHVREVVMKLGAPEGGLWLIGEMGPDVPLENIEALCGALEKYRGYWRQ